jgi:hypothetical protein
MANIQAALFDQDSTSSSENESVVDEIGTQLYGVDDRSDDEPAEQSVVIEDNGPRPYRYEPVRARETQETAGSDLMEIDQEPQEEELRVGNTHWLVDIYIFHQL